MFRRSMITASLGLALVGALLADAKAYQPRNATCSVPDTSEIVILAIDKDNTDVAAVTIGNTVTGRLNTYGASWVYMPGKGVAIKLNDQNAWFGVLDNSPFIKFQTADGATFSAVCGKFEKPKPVRRQSPTNRFLNQF